MEFKTNEYVKIGHMNYLQVMSINQYGYILSSISKQEVIYNTSKKYNINDVIKVFIYTSLKNKLHATSKQPNTLISQYNLFEIKGIRNDGVYVDWGIKKDLFVPNKHHLSKFRIGENKILKVILDKETNQLVGSEKFHKTLIKQTKNLKNKQLVDFIVFSKTVHGYKTIVNNKYEAIILSEDVSDTILRIGMKFEGIVRLIRTDGSILVKFKEKQSKKIENISQHILSI